MLPWDLPVAENPPASWGMIQRQGTAQVVVKASVASSQTGVPAVAPPGKCSLGKQDSVSEAGPVGECWTWDVC